MSSRRQVTLTELFEGIPTPRDIIDQFRKNVDDVSDALGIDLEWFGRQPGDVEEEYGDEDIVRYQYMTQYIFSANRGPAGWRDRGSGYPVQFKSIVYMVGDPPDDMQRYLRETHNGRLRTLFNTGPYSTPPPGYMDNFDFWEKSTSTEGPHPVGIDEVPDTGLGVPRWEVEVYFDDRDMAGYAHGWSSDFGIEEEEVETPEPGEETWHITGWNPSRGDYQISPPGATAARERAKNIQGKRLFINGFPVGTIDSEGRAWLKKSYANPARQEYTDRATIIEQSGTPYQALSKGVNLYKVQETSGGIYLSTVSPRGFTPEDADAIDPEATGRKGLVEKLTIDPSDPTQFFIEQDENRRGALGRYPDGDAREIKQESDFV